MSKPSQPRSRSSGSRDKRSAPRSSEGGRGRPPASPHSRTGIVSEADSRFISSLKPVVEKPKPAVVIAATRLTQVQQVLGEILQWSGPADVVLSRWMREHRELGLRDRSEVAEATFDVLRHLRLYQHLAESGSGPASRRLALLGLNATQDHNILYDSVSQEDASWLRRVSKATIDNLPRAIRMSVPDWLDQRLSRLDNADALIASFNQPASLDIRVNPLKAQRDNVLAGLVHGPAARFSPKATPLSPWGIRLEGRPAVNRWPQFEAGTIEVQDEGSQLLALLVAPKRGEMIIDFCAGAGGKTLLLGALMRSTGRLYAFDVSAKRLARAKPRFARSGLSNVVPVVIDSENDARVKRLAGKAQRVLVDAPCSGTGTLRRNPDLKWRQHPDSLVELCELQLRILSSASRCVAPGGRLVYATCSVLAEENEAQAEAFLASHPDFVQVDAAELINSRCEGAGLTGPFMQLRPDVHVTDGFFGAVFERRKTADLPEEAAAVALPLADEESA